MMLDNGVGLENGCAEFADNVPPPLVPSSLIASWEANGPITLRASVPSSAVHPKPECHDCTTPCVSSNVATIRLSGRRIRTTPRTRSTQKLPSWPLARRSMMPRITAIATAIPTAADAKFWTANPTIWVRLLITTSGEYDCQLVLLTNEIAVLNAIDGSTPGLPSDHGKTPCRR